MKRAAQIALISTGAVAGLVVGALASRGDGPSAELSSFVSRLRDGAILPGQSFECPKGWVQTSKYADTGEHMYSCFAWDRNRVLSLYFCDGKLYGACLVDDDTEFEEHWFFCDEILLGIHAKTVLKAGYGNIGNWRAGQSHPR